LIFTAEDAEGRRGEIIKLRDYRYGKKYIVEIYVPQEKAHIILRYDESVTDPGVMLIDVDRIIKDDWL
jgi:hypothetical protein